MNEGTVVTFAIAQLKVARRRVEASGPVAESGCWIGSYTKKGIKYARIVFSSPAPGEQKTEGIGPVGEAHHRSWQAMIERRNQLKEIDRRMSTP